MDKKGRGFILPVGVFLTILIAGCSALQPVRSAAAQSPAYFVAPTPAPTPTPVKPTQSSTEGQPANCTNVLSFESDLTVPDGTFVDPGSSLDKQWQVRNSGTCNWNSSYTLQKIDGDDLGVTGPQAIVPARSGSEATLRIVFTAPGTPGNYSSTWQAFDPEGQPFGDYFSIVINVANK